MKKLVVIILFLLPLFAWCQSVKKDGNGDIIELKSTTGNYCIVKASINMATNLVVVQASEDIYSFIDASNGKKKKFNTEAHVLNYMTESGWELAGTYSNETMTCFIFKKKT